MNEYFTVSIQRLKGDTKRLPLETEHNLCCKWNIGDKLAKLKFENSVSNLAQKCKEFEKVSVRSTHTNSCYLFRELLNSHSL